MFQDPSVQQLDQNPYSSKNEEVISNNYKLNTLGSSSITRQCTNLKDNSSLPQNLYRVVLPKVQDEKVSKIYENVSRNKSQALFQRTVDRHANQTIFDWRATQNKLVSLTNRNVNFSKKGSPKQTLNNQSLIVS